MSLFHAHSRIRLVYKVSLPCCIFGPMCGLWRCLHVLLLLLGQQPERKEVQGIYTGAVLSLLGVQRC